jgi:hypothetical protein
MEPGPGDLERRSPAGDDDQLDLFAVYDHTPPPRSAIASPMVIQALDDAALVAAIPGAGLLETVALAGEAGRRRLASALPALATVIRGLSGYGARGGVVREQAAALEALGAIGGAGAARIVEQAILRQEVQGATLEPALAAAARLGVKLPQEATLAFLAADAPAIRAGACRCARTQSAAVLEGLAARLEDADFAVRTAAACVLGALGRPDARPALWRALDAAPSAGVIEALIAAADNDTLVRLGRWARERPLLRAPIAAALAELEDPLAKRIVRGLGGEA